MDSTDDNKNNDVERMCRTLWVGNLHPKVSYKNVAELFYQVIIKSAYHIICLIILLTYICHF